MHGDPLGQVKSGDPFPTSARTWNALLAAARKARQARPTPTLATVTPNADYIIVKNNTGQTIDRFEIMGVDGTLVDAAVNLDYFKNSEPTFNGILPVENGAICVMLEKTSHDGNGYPQIGRAIIAGYVQVLIDVAQETDQFAVFLPGVTTSLKSDATKGFPILAKAAGTGLQWGIVHLGIPGGGEKEVTLIKNNTASTVSAWGVLQIDGVYPTPTADLAGFQTAPVFQGVAPKFSAFNKKLAIVTQSLPAGETGPCLVTGHAPVKIYSQHDPDPKFCHASASVPTTRLEALYRQNNHGYPILYREPGTGEKWGIVDLKYHDEPGWVSMFGWGMVPGIALPNNSIGWTQIGSPVDLWYHDPSQPETNFKFANNSVCDIENTPTGLRISGPSAWQGVLHCNINVITRGRQLAQLYGGGWPASAYQTAGYAVELKLRHYSDATLDDNLITTNTYYLKHHNSGGVFLLSPGSANTSQELNHQVTFAFTLQTRPGNKVSRLCLTALFFAATHFQEVDPRYGYLAIGRWSLHMHEINPFVTDEAGGGGTIPESVFAPGGISFGDDSAPAAAPDFRATAPEIIIPVGQTGEIPINGGSGAVPEP